MKIFPSKALRFKLIGDQEESLNILKRRTEKCEYLTSEYTDKFFRGIINGNEFKLISSTIGKGVFCVMKGTIESDKGSVTVEIHRAFRILFIIVLLLSFIAFFGIAIIGDQEFSTHIVLVAITLPLIIRYVFIELSFRSISKDSLTRLRDVIDFEWI